MRGVAGACWRKKDGVEAKCCCEGSTTIIASATVQDQARHMVKNGMFLIFCGMWFETLGSGLSKHWTLRAAAWVKMCYIMLWKNKVQSISNWVLKINAYFFTLIPVTQLPFCKMDPYSFAGYVTKIQVINRSSINRHHGKKWIILPPVCGFSSLQEVKHGAKTVRKESKTRQ